jgi:hypothetical protein
MTFLKVWADVIANDKRYQGSGWEAAHARDYDGMIWNKMDDHESMTVKEITGSTYPEEYLPRLKSMAKRGMVQCTNPRAAKKPRSKLVDGKVSHTLKWRRLHPKKRCPNCNLNVNENDFADYLCWKCRWG